MNKSNENFLDFVIPLCNANVIIQITIESIVVNYRPRTIYIITNLNDIIILENTYTKWNIYDTKIVFLDEEEFFLYNYGLKKVDINKWYYWKDERSREFGWWYQQLLKLGACKQIKNLSDPYIVWDSDLIVLKKWELYDKESNIYKFAILQENPKNDFNKVEYYKSIYDLIEHNAIVPENEGTFVPHHFVIHHNVINDMLSFIENKNIENDNWIMSIMLLSKKYYRFSEYMCIACFMKNFYPELLHFYPFNDYGANGIRYRETKEIIQKLINFCKKEKNINLFDENLNISYHTFVLFVKSSFNVTPTYIQLEHVK
jgi:hypothetical protein